MTIEHYHLSGDNYYHGNGVKKNERLAFLHWGIGAELGNEQCIKNLAWAYSAGIGCEVDLEASNYWATRAGRARPPWRIQMGADGHVGVKFDKPELSFQLMLLKEPIVNEEYLPKVSHGLPGVLFDKPELSFQSMPPIDASNLSIHWLMPDWDLGGGGHMTLFVIISYLERFGHNITIWIDEPRVNKTPEEAYDNIISMYGITLAAQVKFFSKEFYSQVGNAMIATGWDTAYPVSRCLGFNERFYFVQDYEPYFFPRGSNHVLAENSYQLGLSHICAGTWLRHKMESKGQWARHFYLGFDEDYYIKETPKSDVPILAVYARTRTSRRCVELILGGLEVLAKRGRKVEVEFYGGDAPIDESYAHRVTNRYILSRDELCELYNRATLGICFSGTNYSRVPIEMMACGLPVVELDGESTRAAFPEGVVEFACPTPMQIADSIEALLDDPERRQRQADKALDWVKPLTWESAARQVESAIIDRLGE